ncbi:MAG: TonB-dependent receptor, partial [Bacteroidales bacterium]|nr:TonB-dependent receptor [Bacteroidales bacterium]
AVPAGAGNSDPGPVEASPQTVVYSGKVVDAQTGEPLIGAYVLLKGTQTGTVTDSEGCFSLGIPSGVKPVLEVAYISYTTETITPSGTTGIVVRMKNDANFLDEVQVVAYGQQRKMSVTGAIVSIGSEDLLKSPSGSAASALAGAISGVSTVQTSGQPGAEDPDIYVRGTGSLSSELSKPLILVDGVERSFFQMDPNEIESITVLKDAASTAVFGIRGANGVILVTTKSGQEGKNTISLSSQFGLTQPLRHLKSVSSYMYGTIYNEAMQTDNPGIPESSLKFSPFVLDAFKNHADPIMFPDMDWDDYIFKDLSWQTQHNLSMSGGNERFKYFLSLGYLHQDGIMKQFDMNYNSNYTYNRYNYRANVDIAATNTTNVHIGLGGRVGVTHEPQTYNIWENIMWCTPFSSAGIVDGHYILSSKGNNKYIPIEPGLDGLALFYNWGYTENTANVLNLDMSIAQNLDVLTKGLSINVKGAYNSTYNLGVSRGVTASPSRALTPMYAGYYSQPGMDIANPMFDNTIIYLSSGVDGLDEPMSYGNWTYKGRDWYLEGSLNYSRTFGNHEVSALLLYNQSKTYYPASFSEIPTAYVGYVGRVTYNYKRKYLADFNIGYNGSENFAPGRRYGLFPAGSAGWVISEEPWMEGAKKWVDFLKIRASYGLVGNDKYSGSRFLYLNGSWTPANSVWNWWYRDGDGRGYSGSWQFGKDYSPVMLPDAKENTVGNAYVTWEKVRKQNYGIDLVMFHQQLSITADYFREYRYDILSKRNTLPAISDIQLPLVNLGEVSNHGYEVSAGWNSKVNNFEYYVKGNISFSRNKIIFMDEVQPNYPWMAQTGRITGMHYGYVFDRFLTPDDFDTEGNILSQDASGKVIPSMSIGSPRPGDSLFKDLNGDGKVDGDDCTWFGYSDRPEYVSGFLAGFNWKGIGLSMQWTGAWHASRVLDGEMRIPFGSQNSRTLLTYLADNRWTPENPDARFPRITFLNKTHYIAASDLWLLDGSYLRLKTAELSYTMSGLSSMKKAGISSCKFYISGYNLLTLFSELEKIDIDPEGMTSGYDNKYPNNRIYNIGVNLTF